ncbi:uncharacterized protein MONOS_10932 [Monocercomonoides exilis]|uniref:uncharacterized protein n=1 Tax=Monocercomonoides exilis TaxID=2049356 RepID=UPI003559951E|nr:hypothetical protein MONOS_10932 [Monocercomonoides exilis]|eukprot:MONOS_10932.1-p1 / transcript=MONOS_10932.1 / gene=MONOS_10932 / organism=Monocercomonoides_exilis_PA203 / gene_product=unspecified product / transcript_product=unspecified product / location=Mono_scaffold00520:1184-1456(-) / protein_length=91 / sequence_SO=supercontig / SO=protein_coding / is_pseudo=false
MEHGATLRATLVEPLQLLEAPLKIKSGILRIFTKNILEEVNQSYVEIELALMDKFEAAEEMREEEEVGGEADIGAEESGVHYDAVEDPVL